MAAGSGAGMAWGDDTIRFGDSTKEQVRFGKAPFNWRTDHFGAKLAVLMALQAPQ
jgi:hypothetical protein